MENIEKKRQTVFMLAGVPGCGKSTFAFNMMRQMDDCLISRDNIRFMLLKDDDDYFAREDDVRRMFFQAIKNNTSNNEFKNIFIDATHLSRKVRSQVRNWIRRRPYQIAISFEVPLKVALERNAQRTGRAKVPETVIYNMYHRYEKPTLQEGFDEIWHVDAEGIITKEVRSNE
jgi:predicted kinase